jgi:hypothetical protein
VDQAKTGHLPGALACAAVCVSYKMLVAFVWCVLGVWLVQGLRQGFFGHIQSFVLSSVATSVVRGAGWGGGVRPAGGD